MSTMASALAHELSQPLGAASNYLTAAFLQAEAGRSIDPEIRAKLELSRDALERGGKLLASIRGMVQRGTMKPAAASVTQMVSEVLSLLTSRLPCPVHLDLSPKADLVWADRIMVEQLLLNLIRNAGDAQQGWADPAISLRAELVNDQVKITVDDSGPGIPAQRRATLFEAFKSTKSDGMGMGLAICTVLAERNGGRLWLESKEGSGARFCFTLPAARATATGPILIT